MLLRLLAQRLCLHPVAPEPASSMPMLSSVDAILGPRRWNRPQYLHARARRLASPPYTGPGPGRTMPQNVPGHATVVFGHRYPGSPATWARESRWLLSAARSSQLKGPHNRIRQTVVPVHRNRENQGPTRTKIGTLMLSSISASPLAFHAFAASAGIFAGSTPQIF